MDEKIIGANIRQIRLAGNSSLTEVAKRPVMTKSTLSKIESGQASLPIFRPGDKVGQFKHEGNEFIYLLSGELEVTICSEALVMKAGELLYFDPTQVHKTRPIGTPPARALTCFIEKR